jgi:hypothetical protein
MHRDSFEHDGNVRDVIAGESDESASRPEHSSERWLLVVATCKFSGAIILEAVRNKIGRQLWR